MLRMQEAKQRMRKAKARKPPKATKPKSQKASGTGNAEDAKREEL